MTTRNLQTVIEQQIITHHQTDHIERLLIVLMLDRGLKFVELRNDVGSGMFNLPFTLSTDHERILTITRHETMAG